MAVLLVLQVQLVQTVLQELQGRLAPLVRLGQVHQPMLPQSVIKLTTVLDTLIYQAVLQLNDQELHRLVL
jgi:hypothetical protein